MVTHVTKFDKWLSKEKNRKTINMIAVGVMILTFISVYDYFYQLKNYNEQISFEVDENLIPSESLKLSNESSLIDNNTNKLLENKR